jgi:hypothetical protein
MSSSFIFKWVEYRENLIILKPKLIEVDDLPFHGFRSIYQLNEDGRLWVEQNGLKGFGQTKLPVWSPYLFADFDDNKEGAIQFFEYLKENGIEFYLYDSGNRSYHFHILREIEPSYLVPYTDKMFLKRLSYGADLGIYSTLHPFRLEGTIHSKTGRRKECLYFNKGKALSLTLEVPKEVIESGRSTCSSSIFEDEYLQGLTLGCQDGTRHNNILQIGKTLKQYGMSSSFIEEWVIHSNKLNSPPLEEDELSNLIRWINDKE